MSVQMALEIGRDETLICLAGGRRKLTVYCGSFSSTHPWPDCHRVQRGGSGPRCHPVTVVLRWI